MATAHPFLLQPPDPGTYKLNFDGGQFGNLGRGWGTVIRNHTGDVALVPSEQGPSFKVPDIEEASTCLLGVKCALEAGIKNLIIEGDCLSLINSLKMKRTLDNFLHFIVADILSLTACFDFYSLSFVKRGATWSRMI